jgi:hypothetical protein
MSAKQKHTAVYPHAMRPSKYDGTHFLCYLFGVEAEYKPDDDSEPTTGVSYTGDLDDGGTLIECDEWNRNKLINGIIRTKYLQTEEDSIKTHMLQLLSAKEGIGELSSAHMEEYSQEWSEFDTFRKKAIEEVDGWDSWGQETP